MRKHTGVLAMALLATSVLAANAPHSVLAQNGNGATQRRRLPSARGILGALPGGMVVVDGQNALLVQGAPAATALTTEVISVRNVRPEVMVWWLDPANHPEPAEFRQARELQGGRTAGRMTQGAAGRGAEPQQIPPPAQPRPADMNNGQRRLTPANGAVQLPPGIESLIAIEPQNALLVRGTQESVVALRQMVAFLDRPLQQVEIEAQVVEVGAADAAMLLGATSANGVVAGANIVHNDAAIQGVNPNVQSVLAELLAARRTKIVYSARVTTFNNMTAAVETRTTYFSPNEDPNVPRRTDGKSNARIETSMRFVCTPTINRDGTITIAVRPSITTETLVAGQTLPSPPDVQQSSVITNIKDGGTLVLGGLQPKFSPQGVETQRVIFVTARIVRRNEAVK